MTMPVPGLTDTGENPNPGEPSNQTPPGSPDPKPEPPKESPKGKTFQLSESTLRERLQRASSASLKKHFGTDNVNEITAKLKRLEELESAKKKEDLAKMDEVTRLKTQYEEERQKRLKMEKELKTEKRNSSIKGEESRIRGIFQDHIDERYFPHVARDLANYIINERKLKPEQIANIKEGNLRKWLSNYLKKNPAFAKSGEQQTPKPKQPATNGAPEKKPVANPNPPKEIRPGKTNSMTPAEFAKWKRDNGYNF